MAVLFVVCCSFVGLFVYSFLLVADFGLRVASRESRVESPAVAAIAGLLVQLWRVKTETQFPCEGRKCSRTAFVRIVGEAAEMSFCHELLRFF